jgi:hypothetical protein
MEAAQDKDLDDGKDVLAHAGLAPGVMCQRPHGYWFRKIAMSIWWNTALFRIP